MEVFSKSYLEEVIENQGKLFEYAEEHYSGIDVADFIESYMKSYTRAMVDEGQADSSKILEHTQCLRSWHSPGHQQYMGRGSAGLSYKVFACHWQKRRERDKKGTNCSINDQSAYFTEKRDETLCKETEPEGDAGV